VLGFLESESPLFAILVCVATSLDISRAIAAVAPTDSADMDAVNAATFQGLNQTQDYFTVLDEVSKYNVHLNYVERLWAVRISLSPPNPNSNSLHPLVPNRPC
jgi:hypothetical protein